MQRMLRGRNRVGNFETACRVIVENVVVLPEGTARRHAKTMAPRLVALEGDWAERRLPIRVADRDALPRFARDLVGLLVEDARGEPGRPDSHGFGQQSAICVPIPLRPHGKFRGAIASDDPLQSLSNPTRMAAGRIAAVRPSLPTRAAGPFGMTDGAATAGLAACRERMPDRWRSTSR